MTKNKVILIFIITLSALLRFYHLNNDFVLLYDQGRDLLVAQKILDGKLTLLGPEAGGEGIFYGPLYYYFLAIGLFVFQGNPVGISYIIILLNLLAIYLVYLIARQLFNEETGLISAFLYGISYSLIAFSRWLTNPAIVPPLVLLFFYLLIKSKKIIYPLLLGIISGSILQLEAPSGIFIPIFFFLSFFILKRILRLNDSLKYILGLFLLMFPQILFEFRHNFLSTKAILRFFTAYSSSSFLFTHMLLLNIKEVYRITADTLTPGFPLLAIFLSTLGIIFLLKDYRTKSDLKVKHILILIFTLTPFLLVFSRIFRPAHLIAAFPFLIIIVAMFLDKLFKKNMIIFSFLILLIIVFLNTKRYFSYESFNNYCPNINRINLKNQKSVIDYLYKNSSGKVFHYIAYTIPYWKSDAWQYLFNWYGFKKYQYLPLNREGDVFYIIIEGDPDNPSYLNSWIKEMNKKANLIFEKKIGQILIQRRRAKNAIFNSNPSL